MRAYNECLSDVKKALRAKEMDLVPLVITKRRKSFGFLSALNGFQTPNVQYSPPYLSLHYFFHLSFLILIIGVYLFQLIGRAHIRPVELISMLCSFTTSPYMLGSLLWLFLSCLGSKWQGLGWWL